MRRVPQEAWKSSHRYTSKQKMYIFQHRNFAATTTTTTKHQKICQKSQKRERETIKRVKTNKTIKLRRSRTNARATRRNQRFYNAIRCVFCSVLFSVQFQFQFDLLGTLWHKCCAVCIFYIIFQWMFCFKFNILFASLDVSLFHFIAVVQIHDSSSRRCVWFSRTQFSRIQMWPGIETLHWL